MPSILHSTNCHIKKNFYHLCIYVDDDHQIPTSPQATTSLSETQSTDISVDNIVPSLTRLNFQLLNEKKNGILLSDIMLNRLLSVQQVPSVVNRNKRKFYFNDGMKNIIATPTPLANHSRITSVATLDTIVSDSNATKISWVRSQASFGSYLSTQSYTDKEATSMLKTKIKISYIDVTNSIRWAVKRLELEVESEEEANQLYVTLNMCLSTLQQRPRRLLAFVNPFGGKGNRIKSVFFMRSYAA